MLGAGHDCVAHLLVVSGAWRLVDWLSRALGQPPNCIALEHRGEVVMTFTGPQLCDLSHRVDLLELSLSLGISVGLRDTLSHRTGRLQAQ